MPRGCFSGSWSTNTKNAPVPNGLSVKTRACRLGNNMSRASLYLSIARSGAMASAWLLLTALAGEREMLAQAIAPDFAIRSWDARDGLPPGLINDIERTTNGYLWEATRVGLVRFDGARFKLFDTGNTPGLRTNWVTCLLAEPGGGTVGGDPRRTVLLSGWEAGSDRGGRGRHPSRRQLPCRGEHGGGVGLVSEQRVGARGRRTRLITVSKVQAGCRFARSPRTAPGGSRRLAATRCTP